MKEFRLLVIALLSILTLVCLFVETVCKVTGSTATIFSVFDTTACALFLANFIYELFTAESKKKFLKWGWIDLVSSVPSVGFLRIGRVIRLVRVFRVLRATRSVKRLTDWIFSHRHMSAFASSFLVGCLLIVGAAIAILNVETATTSNIKTASDAIWWAFVTMTTVGYGDFYPVTAIGRIVASMLMLCGIGMFGTYAGMMASWFTVKRVA